MPLIRRPFFLALYGTSLTQGRLNADWPAYLARELQQYPEAKGPIVTYNQGRGSQNSDWGLANIGLIADQRPTHVLMEGFSINDAAVTGGVPAVSIANHDANVTAMVAALRAARADVDITIQTMNPVSAEGAAIRPNLAAYYARDVALAGTLGLTLLDNYGGAPGGPVGGWPKPLDPDVTYGAGPPDYSAWEVGNPAAVTWNPADKSADINLTDGNLTAEVVSGAGAKVRATLSRQLGKFQFGTTILAVSGVDGTSVGIARPTSPLNIGPGADAHSQGIIQTGQIFGNGALMGVGAPYGVGDEVGWAIDATRGVSWVHVNGTWYGGGAVNNPTTGEGGFAYAPGPIFPAVGGLPGSKFGGIFNGPAPGDGLHPIFAGAVDTYLYPNVVTWARGKMAAHWPG
jgi:hypothetical protein